MFPFKDIARVANGLSLVAKEAIARRSTDTLIKGALLSATDAVGLTKGNLRTLDTPHNNHDDSTTSIVYFDHHPNHNPNEELPDETQSLPVEAADADVPLPVPSTSDHPHSHSQPELGAPSTSTRAASPSPVVGDVNVIHRRNPRERRVPSTPFSRAIGYQHHLTFFSLFSESTNKRILLIFVNCFAFSLEFYLFKPD